MKKQKSIPKSVIFFLLAMGFFCGTIATMLEALIIGFLKGFVIAYWIIALQVTTTLGLLYLVQWRYKTALEEWGMIELPTGQKK